MTISGLHRSWRAMAVVCTWTCLRLSVCLSHRSLRRFPIMRPEIGGCMAQVWLVTGSSRGLGRAIVEAGLAAGNKVLATARDTESLRDLTERYGDEGGSSVLSPEEGGPFSPVFVDGRKDRPPRTRTLFGSEMGRRRFLRSVVARSRTARHQSHYCRARWVPHGLRWQFHEAERRASRIRPNCGSNR